MEFRTKCARGSSIEGSIGRPLSPPIVMSSTFRFNTLAEIDEYYETGEGYLYSRYGNPTVRGAERFLAELEGGEQAAMFASGMSAISTTLLTLAGAGDTVAAQRELYGGTAHLLADVLPDLGIRTRWLDREELQSLTPGMLDGCKLLYLETPINPTLRIVDLARASEVASRAGIGVVVDCTLGTPALQRPLSLGCRLVVHSCTKYLGGHSDLLGGAVVGDREGWSASPGVAGLSGARWTRLPPFCWTAGCARSPCGWKHTRGVPRRSPRRCWPTRVWRGFTGRGCPTFRTTNWPGSR